MTRTARYIITFIVSAFLLITIIESLQLTMTYGGVDLRCRIVSTRLLFTDKSPYFYQWDSTDSDYYLEPNFGTSNITNGNVVTPATMTVIYPLAILPYAQVRIIWTILCFIAAAGIILLIFKRGKISDTYFTSFPLILGMICSELWLMNIERGQMYIFYAFLFALIYRLYISKIRRNQFFSGLVAGLFIYFRPFAGIIGLAFLLSWKKQWIIGCLTGFSFGFLVFVLPFQQTWKDYFTAMSEYINIEMGHPTVNPNEKTQVIPSVIEGTTNLTNTKWIFPVGKMQNLYNYFLRFNIHITVAQCLTAFSIFILAMAGLFYRYRKKMKEPESLFLFGFLLFIFSEIFIPAPRGPYNVILWIFPLSLIYFRFRKSVIAMTLLFTAFLLLHNFPFHFRGIRDLPELTFALLTFTTVFFPELFKTLSDGNSRIQRPS